MSTKQQIDAVYKHIATLQGMQGVFESEGYRAQAMTLDTTITYLTTYAKSLKSTLKSQDLTDPAWHDT